MPAGKTLAGSIAWFATDKAGKIDRVLQKPASRPAPVK